MSVELELKWCFYKHGGGQAHVTDEQKAAYEKEVGEIIAKYNCLTYAQERVMAKAESQAGEGPRDCNEHHWFYQGFLAGATAYAVAKGESGLFRKNPTLKEVLGEQRQKTAEAMHEFVEKETR